MGLGGTWLLGLANHIFTASARNHLGNPQYPPMVKGVEPIEKNLFLGTHFFVRNSSRNVRHSAPHFRNKTPANALTAAVTSPIQRISRQTSPRSSGSRLGTSGRLEIWARCAAASSSGVAAQTVAKILRNNQVRRHAFQQFPDQLHRSILRVPTC